MSYEPNTWSNGDTITATKLNNMEAGVQDMNSEYTPTTQANGDTITAEKLNHIEQGIADGGGGGGGDLINAVVSVTSDSTTVLSLDSHLVNAADVGLSLSGYLIDNRVSTIEPGSSKSILVPHNGLIYSVLDRTIEVVEGNATVVTQIEDGVTFYVLRISGDCTVKLTSPK